MKKQFLHSVLVLFVGLFLMVPLAAAKVTIKVAHVDRGDRHESMMEAFASTFKDLVESQSGGEMEVVIYPAAQLGGMRELVEFDRARAPSKSCPASPEWPQFFPPRRN